ncbi:MAG: DUF2878 domain-containing protein [Candidatus Methylomirabilota bacterium]
MLSDLSGRTTLVNLLLFQAGWFACVFGAAAGRPLLAAASGLLLVLAHLALVRHPRREARLLLAALLLGVLIDSLHLHTGVLRFGDTGLHPALPPPWLLVLWLQFAATLHYALAWITSRPLLALGFGALGGPLAYWAGVRVGAAGFGADLGRCLVQIGIGWAVAMALLLRVAARTAPDPTARTYRFPAVRF